ncbi:MAG: NAD-dependent DNA ligase LigA [Planctomycetota bacterium]|nr:NAD-dependent DNA ligase LigA [Planctomycetota bacterium]
MNARRKQHASHLEQEIRRHRDLYYNRQPEITDAEFDALVEELEKLAPDSPVLAEVGTPVDPSATGLPKKRHRIPMGSLDKVPEERLDAWAEKTGPLYLVQEKYDGISLELEYEKSGLVDAITRGDGFVGEVVTHNALAFKNVEKRLPAPFTGSVRGEVILRKSLFEKEFAGIGFANPRNTVSGLVRKKHGDRSLNRHFEVFFYDVVSDDRRFETEREKMLFLREELQLRLAVSYFDQTIEQVRGIYQEYVGDEHRSGKRSEIDYEIDGLVVRANSVALQEKLGVSHNRPRFATAYKFPSEGKVTTLKRVDWSLGIGARVTPVARLEPVRISGVTVSNATLHNADYIQDLDVRLEDEVYVERRGDVIPQVMRVAESRGGKIPRAPKKCPTCDQSIQREGKFLVCPNPECPGKSYGDLFRWIMELDIDSLGEKWVRTLIDKGLIQEPVDLYSLTVESLLPLERMGETLATKLVQNIAETRRPPLDRFVAGLNIPGFSRQRMQMLIDNGVGSLQQLLALKPEEITGMKGFGDILAQAVVQGLERRRERIDRLLEADVVPREAAASSASSDGPLSGASFCFTGAVRRVDENTGKAYTRKRLRDLVAQRGGRALNDVSSGLDYLVMADPTSTSSKAKKARKLGTRILSEDDFFAMLADAGP